MVPVVLLPVVEKPEIEYAFLLEAVLWIRPHFFGFGFLRLIFWPQIFLNGASNCFHMCSRTCTSEKKKLSTEKHKIFLFKVFDFWFFTKIFFLQQCLNPNPYPNFLFGFGFGSSQNIRIISDSDPQHWLEGRFIKITSPIFQEQNFYVKSRISIAVFGWFYRE
jgi:hypothetical protein